MGIHSITKHTLHHLFLGSSGVLSVCLEWRAFDTLADLWELEEGLIGLPLLVVAGSDANLVVTNNREREEEREKKRRNENKTTTHETIREKRGGKRSNGGVWVLSADDLQQVATVQTIVRELPLITTIPCGSLPCSA